MDIFLANLKFMDFSFVWLWWVGKPACDLWGYVIDFLLFSIKHKQNKELLYILISIYLVLHRPEDLRIPFERYGPVKDVYLPKNYYTGYELSIFLFVWTNDKCLPISCFCVVIALMNALKLNCCESWFDYIGNHGALDLSSTVMLMMLLKQSSNWTIQ